MLSTTIAAALIVMTGGVSRPLLAYTSTLCPAADPYDSNTDDAALQACLDTYDVVELEPTGGHGYVGYIIGGDGLRLKGAEVGRSYGPIMTTSGSGQALLIADPDLDTIMIESRDDAPGWELHNLIVDGNRYNRNNLTACNSSQEKRFGSNIYAYGRGFRIVSVASVRAKCGTSLKIAGDDFEVTSSQFIDNGTEIQSVPYAISDGMTVARCDNGYIHDNSFEDNTDVDLVLFTINSGYCYIARNDVSHTGKVGIAGIGVGADEDGTPGLQLWDNDIYADHNKLRIGMAVGYHAWSASVDVGDIGEIYDNTIYGAAVNLSVDGIADGQIWNNSMSAARGTNGMNGCYAYDYIAGHFGSASIQTGYTSLVYDGTNCHTP
jgi:hypothetical protein